VGIDATGTLSYGINYGYDYHFPWEEGEYDYWMEIYWEAKTKLKEKTSCPFVWVYYGDDSYAGHIVALSKNCAGSYYSDPVDPKIFEVSEEDKQLLLDFCNEHCPPPDGEEPRWWLTSYLG
jgi:hypothetical protein